MVEIHQFPVSEKEVDEPDLTPHSVEAEQQLLGAILVNNDNLVKVQGILKHEHFYDPVHARIYKLSKNLINRDKLASPVTLTAFMIADEGLKELGGPGYLARLAGSAISPRYVGEYARMIVAHAESRFILQIIDEAKKKIQGDNPEPGDVAASIASALSAMEFKTSGVQPVSMMAATTKALDSVVKSYHGAEVPRVRTGIDAIDKFVPGMKSGELWLVGGRPSMGKSALALNIGLNANRAGHPVVFASLEMTPEALAARALSEQTADQGFGVPYSNFEKSDLTERQMRDIVKASEVVSRHPMWFLPQEYASIELLGLGIKQSLRNYSGDMLPLVIVDYVQLIRASKSKSIYEQITEVSKLLKSTAMLLQVPVLALSQLSRAVEQRNDKRPQLSDLRESGQLEQDADGVMFCYREAYYLGKEQPGTDDLEALAKWQDAMERCKNDMDVIIAKHRQGDIGTAKLLCNLSMNRIWGR